MIKKLSAIFFLVIIICLAGFLIFRKEEAKKLVASDLHQAKYYEVLNHNIVRCNLCPNRCILSEGQIGLCRARKNIEGELYSLVYGKVSSAHVDPIEKKPLYHVLPGAKAYSIATTGCNLQCKFCQNWQLAQVFPWEVQSADMPPEKVVQNALSAGAELIAFTYNEPTIFYEYMFDIAKLAKENGLKTVVISSGYINPEPLRELLPYIDAYKIDFKGFDNKFYQKWTNGTVEPVLETMKIIKQQGVWLEVVNLLIPGENDSEEDIKNLALWIKDNLGSEIPLHFSRFHPDYKMLNKPPTPIDTVKQARQIALNIGLKYVYTGNIYDPEGSTTYCPDSDLFEQAGQKAITREGFFIKINNLNGSGECADGGQIPGVWQ